MSEQEWVTVGAAVASVTHGRNGNTVRYAKIDRIGKRDIVLDNGERFNVRTLSRREGDTWSGRDVRLMRRDDPHVADTVARIRHANTLRAALDACDEFRYTGSVRGSKVVAADVILALAPLAGVEDEIRALFEPTPDPRGLRAEGEGGGVDG